MFVTFTAGISLSPTLLGLPCGVAPKVHEEFLRRRIPSCVGHSHLRACATARVWVPGYP